MVNGLAKGRVMGFLNKNFWSLKSNGSRVSRKISVFQFKI